MLIADTLANEFESSPPLPGFSATDIAIPSEDGGVLYQFDATGRHLRTVNALTGATLYQFAYDGAGRLTTVTTATATSPPSSATAPASPPRSSPPSASAPP